MTDGWGGRRSGGTVERAEHAALVQLAAGAEDQHLLADLGRMPGEVALGAGGQERQPVAEDRTAPDPHAGGRIVGFGDGAVERDTAEPSLDVGDVAVQMQALAHQVCSIRLVSDWYSDSTGGPNGENSFSRRSLGGALSSSTSRTVQYTTS